jgi:hypothetical protein
MNIQNDRYSLLKLKKMKIIIGIGRLVFAILMFIAVNQGCEKEDPKPILETIVAHEIFSTSAISGADIITAEGLQLSAKGVCWSTTPEPTIADSHTNDGGGLGNFKSLMHGLLPSTSYYYRAYAVTELGTSYGNTLKFATEDTNIRLLQSDSIVQLTPRSFRVYATNYLNSWEIKIIKTGFCYAHGKIPDMNDSLIYDNGSLQRFNKLIQVEHGEPFTVRPFVMLKNGNVLYGEALEGFPGRLDISVIDRITFRSARVVVELDDFSNAHGVRLFWGTALDDLNQDAFFTNIFATIHHTFAWNLQPNTTYYVRPRLSSKISYDHGNSYYITDWVGYSSFTTPPIPDIGNGTYEYPYTIDGALFFAPFTEHIWVEGYIVGEFDHSGRRSNFSPPFVQEFAIMLANEIDEMFGRNTLWVTLPSGPISQALNLKDNPGNKGRKLRIQGNVYRHFEVYMNEVQEFELE